MIFLVAIFIAIFGTVLFKIVIFILIGLLLALLVWGIVCCFSPASTITEITQDEIYALADNARYSGAVSGSVFLVQSRVNETLKYSYMYLEDGKGYGFKEVPADRCYINYTTEQPYVICNQYDFANGVLRWLFPNIFGREYIFYLPENAQVIDDFTIDFN